jgi:Carboxypeptidase regulatory-like domain
MFQPKASNVRRLTIQLAVAALLFCDLSAIAQNTAGSITGVVHDSQGAVIPNATVTALNQDENAINGTVSTNRQGVFVFNVLKAATYTITVEAQGFKKYSQKDILLNVNDALGLPAIVMTLGAVSESISVEANAVTLETVTATRSAVVDNTQLQELPIATRTTSGRSPAVLPIRSAISTGSAPRKL